jgi:hypothetical protein
MAGPGRSQVGKVGTEWLPASELNIRRAAPSYAPDGGRFARPRAQQQASTAFDRPPLAPHFDPNANMAKVHVSNNIGADIVVMGMTMAG